MNRPTKHLHESNINSKIRVLHLITGLNVGGAEMALFRLVTGMNTTEFDSCVVCMIKPGQVGKTMTESGIQVYSLDMPQGKVSLIGFIKLIKILLKFKPHILQTWLYHADFLGLIAAKLTGIRPVLWNIRCSSMNDNGLPRLTRLVTKICAILSPTPDAIIINSKTGIEDHKKLGYRPRKWFLIPNGIDTLYFQPDKNSPNLFSKEFGVPEDKIIIGVVGRFHPQKDHENFLYAASIIHQSSNEVIFILVGDGPEKYINELKKLSHQLDLENNLIWAGLHQNMPAVYNSFDYLVLSSAYGEGFPNVIAEGMACGVPCISTNVGDSSEIIGNTGIILEPNNPKLLAISIQKYINLSKAERKKLSGQARNRIMENYDSKKMILSYSNLYKEITRKPNLPF